MNLREGGKKNDTAFSWEPGGKQAPGTDLPKKVWLIKKFQERNTRIVVLMESKGGLDYFGYQKAKGYIFTGIGRLMVEDLTPGKGRSSKKICGRHQNKGVDCYLSANGDGPEGMGK